jgi:hypothetical protein
VQRSSWSIDDDEPIDVSISFGIAQYNWTVQFKDKMIIHPPCASSPSPQSQSPRHKFQVTVPPGGHGQAQAEVKLPIPKLAVATATSAATTFGVHQLWTELKLP